MKKTFSLILLAAVLLLLIPPMTALAATTTVKYLDESGTEQSHECIIVESGDGYTFESGKWYAVTGNVTITKRIENNAAENDPAHLILADGCKFSVPKGIRNNTGKGLVISGQTNGTGELKIDSVEGGNAGIGGNGAPDLPENAGALTVNGGTVSVSGCDDGACIGGGGKQGGMYDRGGNGGTVTINGGTVNVGSSSEILSAGIGGGCCTFGGDSGDITINGGTVTSFTRNYGIGCGRGYSSKWKETADGNAGKITISGGTVSVQGIVGGKDGIITIKDASLKKSPRIYGKEVYVENGTVSATEIRYTRITIRKSDVTVEGIGIYSNEDGEVLIEDSTVVSKAALGNYGLAAIGGGNGTNVTIVRSVVTAVNNDHGAGIGGSKNATPGKITITDSDVTASALDGAGIGGGGRNAEHADEKGGSGGTVTIKGSTVTAISSEIKGPLYIQIGAGIGGGDHCYDHGTLSLDETAYELLSGSAAGQEYRSAKTYMGSPDPYVVIRAIPSYTVHYLGSTIDGTGYETLKTTTQTGHTGAQTSPKVLTFNGFSFSNMDEAKTIASDGSTVVNVYYTRLTGSDKVAVSFNTMNGSFIETQVINAGENAVKPAADPAREGYTFGGWYADSTCGIAFDFNQAIHADTVVYAKWDKLPTPIDVRLCRIEITAPPAKTVYEVGETFSQAGMVVTAYYNDNTSAVVSGYEIVDLHPLAAEDMEVTIRYTENGVARQVKQAVRVKSEPTPGDLELYGIVISTPPDKTTYAEGESFDPTGMEVFALYARPITNYSLSPFGDLKKTDTDITVSYTENGVTKTALQPIYVGPVKEPYKIILGANQTIPESAASAVFSSNAGFGKFVRVEVDGKTVPSGYYTAKSGSTVITFTKEYISTLKKGDHTLCIVSSDGGASTRFKVVPSPVVTPADAQIYEGETATFTVKAEGTGLTYQWYIDRSDGRGWRKLDGAKNAGYTTAKATLSNDGYRYKCSVSGVDSDAATLHVLFHPAPVPPTGDSNRPGLWSCMLVISLLGVLVTLRKFRFGSF